MFRHRAHDLRTPRGLSLNQRHRPSGFSMTECVWVIALLGILATLLIARVGTVIDGAEETAARQKLEMLNDAVHAYAQTGKEIIWTANTGTSADELIVLHFFLQWRQTTNPQPGSPFVSTRYQPTTSSSTSDYRLTWTGSLYKLLLPGDTGVGLKVPFDGSDMRGGWTQPDGSNPYGY